MIFDSFLFTIPTEALLHCLCGSIFFRDLRFFQGLGVDDPVGALCARLLTDDTSRVVSFNRQGTFEVQTPPEIPKQPHSVHCEAALSFCPYPRTYWLCGLARSENARPRQAASSRVTGDINTLHGTASCLRFYESVGYFHATPVARQDGQDSPLPPSHMRLNALEGSTRKAMGREHAT